MLALKLNYTYSSHPQYNGNISSIQWNTEMFGIHDYQFVYDAANRLTIGYTENYSTHYDYDQNGNLISLSRSGKLGAGSNYGLIDEMAYTYIGNHLQSVNDTNNSNHQNNGFSDNGSFSGNEYSNDANGNMITDLNKSLSIGEYKNGNLSYQNNQASFATNELPVVFPPNISILKNTIIKLGTPSGFIVIFGFLKSIIKML